MAKTKKLAEAEAEIMVCVWDMPEAVTVREVHQKLYPEGQKAYTTVQTIMNILYDKKYLSRQKIGMVNFYRPLVSRTDAAKLETRSLVSRVFQGSFGAMANYLVNSGELTDSDLNELKTLIAAKEKDQK